MNSPQDGGPAFPSPLASGQSYNSGSHFGMTLRDYFAAAALQGLMVGYHEHPNQVDMCAEIACDAADAMLAARKRKEQP